MRTKNVDRRSVISIADIAPPVPPSFPDTVAYWLEDDLGRRISKFFTASEKPLRLAGRALENIGTLDGWAVARRDGQGGRHVVASGAALAELATPFKPMRTPAEEAVLGRFLEALRRDPDFPSRAAIVSDERVY
jgi:hypothetical protein